MGTPWVGSLSLLGLMGPLGLIGPLGLMGPQGLMGPGPWALGRGPWALGHGWLGEPGEGYSGQPQKRARIPGSYLLIID